MFNKKPIASSVFAIGKDEKGNQFGNTGYKSNFDENKLSGLEKYKPHEGLNKIDVIPFNAGPTHPLVISGQCAEGDTMYSLDYFVHKAVGPTGSDFTCLKQFGKPCPCCKETSRLYDLKTEAAKKQADSLRSKRRCVYIVHDLIDGKYYWCDQPWFSFEKPLNARAAITIDSKTQAPVTPFDWQHGKTITFSGEKSKWNGREFIKINEATFGFLDRDGLTDKDFEYSQDLSVAVIIPTEEDMENALAGKPVANTPAQNAPAPETTQPSPIGTADLAAQAAQAAQPSFNNMETVPQVAPAPAPTCPFGHNWKEADKHAECAKCKIWEDCFADSAS